MDDDPVLRALGEDLARDDPDLAARLTAGPGAGTGRRSPPGRGLLWLLVAGAVVAVGAPFLVGPRAFGVMAVLLLLGCPLAVSRWCLTDGPGPLPPGDDPPPSAPPV
ncbi:DUF3040 domain-containing protein [Geodermatophilus sp. TF02-6]|uniref:DUF3040 domain-containing protein n=1 Tax=Geodermatophilus sp. TF02-6 TaxID=2250575 RepID=UPI001314C69D|nr:DUF3040 domain-containing protein [Geodermatophilus sp. TF02-6]